MRVISIIKIKEAMSTYPQWRVGLQLWYDTFNKSSLNFESYQQIKDQWLSQSGWNTDRVPARKIKDCSFQGDNYDTYIFDIHKTDCRVVSRIDTKRNKIFIRGIFSHAEYEKWCKANIT
ncbi:type II toxin-antitoxin system HigB family toxin [Vibrio cholerae]|nr:hypothetical protein [Vibrio cholerae]ELH0871312.1 type II toxin-antitoxin system HigB family toxin [Vibrio cholerae]HDL9454471.1 type II toxin-antitoxin system HigB family toxin [Vibrio cholerae]